MALVSLKNTYLYIWYGGGASENNPVAVRVGEGNISWSEKRSIEYVLDRGRLAYESDTSGGAAREGDDQPVDASFDILWDWASAKNPVNVLKGLDPTDGVTPIASAHAADPCAPHAVTIEVVVAPSCGGVTVEDSVVHYILPFFRHESLDYAVDAGQISCSGTCQAKEVIIVTGGGADPVANAYVEMD